MSDYSDIEDDYMDSPHSGPSNPDDPKRHARAQHNALERRRRDNIKDMYSSLRDAVPEMNSERASRAVILKKAIDAIEARSETNVNLTEEKRKLEEENNRIQTEIRKLEQEIADGQSGRRHNSLPPTPEMKFAPTTRV